MLIQKTKALSYTSLNPSDHQRGTGTRPSTAQARDWTSVSPGAESGNLTSNLA